jgi:periplasmic protein TonB
MLAYAPRPERRRINSPALALIIGAHAIALVAVMSAKMEVIRRSLPPTVVELIPNPPPPEPAKQPPQAPKPAPDTAFASPDPVVEPPPLPGPSVLPLPQPPLPGPALGADPLPPEPLPIVRSGPRFATAEADIRPPYPDSKRELDQEAVLRLRLSIDERGRVVAVEPVGKADPVFLAAARRHILNAWRYKPAMEGDRAVPSSTVVSLEFRLDF